MKTNEREGRPGQDPAEGDPPVRNVYDDDARAAAYSTLDFPGTYYLAYRDLPELIAAHVAGRRALDFGCGSGRSTRFLQQLGFEVTGVDISASMLERARALDPAGQYVHVRDGDLETWPPGSYDLILSAFAFDNIFGDRRRVDLLSALRRQLRPLTGRLLLLGSAPEIYLHEWLSFSTKAFPQNREARSGDPVRIVMTDVADSRPVVDVLVRDEDYRSQFASAGLSIVQRHDPLGRSDEPYAWKTEREVAPWVIYVLGETSVA